jgi:putative flippase GtrA
MQTGGNRLSKTPASSPPRTRTRAFFAFFGGSAVGLAIDLIGFQVLVFLGLPPWLANAVSSTVSITAVYLLVSRYAFAASVKVGSYLLFLGWYGLSIFTFSTLIQVASAQLGGAPIMWKLLSVPLSFALNYLFSRFLFSRHRPAPRSQTVTSP